MSKCHVGHELKYYNVLQYFKVAERANFVPLNSEYRVTFNKILRIFI